MISDEAVEAAARGVYATCGDEPEDPENYDGEPDIVKDHYRALARTILEAAVPHMQVERRVPPLTAAEWYDLRQLPDPYRSQGDEG